MKILLSGIPGTGKTTIAKLVSKATGIQVIELNSIAKDFGLYQFRDTEMDSQVVKLKPLEKIANEILKLEKSAIIEGHLGVELKLKVSRVIVLRTNPIELAKRLKKRKYSTKKINENISAEFLDYCTIMAEKNYGKSKVLEVDSSSRKPKEIAAEIIRLIKEKKKVKSKIKSISWSHVAEEHPKLLRI